MQLNSSACFKGNLRYKMIYCCKLHFFVRLKKFFTELKNYVSFLRYLHFYIFSSLLKAANYDVIMNIKPFGSIWQSTFLVISIKPIRVCEWNLVNMDKKMWRAFFNNFFDIFVDWKLVPGPSRILQKWKYLYLKNKK